MPLAAESAIFSAARMLGDTHFYCMGSNAVRDNGGELHQSGINDGDGQILEICAVERQQAEDTVALHGSGEPGVVGPEAFDAEGPGQLMPPRQKIAAIGQKREAALEKAEPLAGLGGREPETVFAGGSLSRVARRHRPEFI
jgi:hypothetical protein